MNENIKWIAAAVAVVGLSIGAVVYVSNNPRKPPPAAEKPVTEAPPPVAAAVPEEAPIQHPVPETPREKPLPELNDSDSSMAGVVEKLVGKESIERFIVTDQLVRHIVTSIDNMTEQKVVERIRPMRRVPGEFVAGGTEEAPVLDPENFKRYEPMVQFVSSIDTKELAASYQRNYPLFQQAYESLGHPPQYFNDRLVFVIDHLLATPDITDPIPLARPKVQYEYADPKLESMSAGQKLLIRMGPANATVVKAKLRELRAAVVAR